MRNSKPITVTPGDEQDRIDCSTAWSADEKARETKRAGLRAPDGGPAISGEFIGDKIREALNDPAPDIAAKVVFDDIRAHHAKRLEADRNGS